MVIITVVCCSPEKIRDKLCYKGGGSIKSIEIVEEKKVRFAEPEKKKEEEKPKADPPKKEAGQPKLEPEKDGGEKPKAEPEKKKDGGEKPKAEPEKKKDGGEKPKSEPEKKKDGGEKPKAGPETDKPKDKPAPALLPVQPQIAAPMAVPVGMVYAPAPCYGGRPVGPFYEYGGPVLRYEGYYARPVYDSYGYGGGGRPYYPNSCDQYFSEENPSGCIIM